MLRSVQGLQARAISAHFRIQCQSKADAASPLAARCARVVGETFALSSQRAQGMPDARCTRDLVSNVHKKVRPRAYRAAENIRHSLRNGFTAYSELSPENGSFASVAPWKLLPPGALTPAPRRQDHTPLPYAQAPFVIGAFTSTASHRTFVAIMIRPSGRVRRADS
jgi:hypothetical protein